MPCAFCSDPPFPASQRPHSLKSDPGALQEFLLLVLTRHNQPFWTQIDGPSTSLFSPKPPWQCRETVPSKTETGRGAGATGY